jgi:hypothetical protein
MAAEAETAVTVVLPAALGALGHGVVSTCVTATRVVSTPS